MLSLGFAMNYSDTFGAHNVIITSECAVSINSEFLYFFFYLISENYKKARKTGKTFIIEGCKTLINKNQWKPNQTSTHQGPRHLLDHKSRESKKLTAVLQMQSSMNNQQQIEK